MPIFRILDFQKEETGNSVDKNSYLPLAFA
jgi:hypothetical protein